MDDLTRLLELPALARLSADGGELQLITLMHDHADRVVVERRRLGGAIDLHELLSLVGLHGVAEAPHIELSAPHVPELPAPVEPPAAPMPTARRTRKRPEATTCVDCEKTFASPQALRTHLALEQASREWPCPKCNQVFNSAQALGSHSKAHRNKPVPVVAVREPAAAPDPATKPECFVCPQCGKQFKSKVGYTTHIDIAHKADVPADAPSTPLREYSCTACSTPLLGHLRCSECQALLGPGHDAGTPHMIVNGKPLCRVCVSYHSASKNLMRMP